jgi:hypothetical protein
MRQQSSYQHGENDGKKQTPDSGDHIGMIQNSWPGSGGGRRGLPDRRHRVPHLQSRHGNDRAFPVPKAR